MKAKTGRGGGCRSRKGGLEGLADCLPSDWRRVRRERSRCFAGCVRGKRLRVSEEEEGAGRVERCVTNCLQSVAEVAGVSACLTS